MSDQLKETRIDSALVYEGVFLKVRKDLARLPDGSQAVREFVEHPGAACMVPLFDDGRLLIERQFRYPLQQTFIEFPAGKLDRGERAIETARRELLEETGYEASQWAFLTRIHPTIGFSDEILDIFLCRGLSALAVCFCSCAETAMQIVTSLERHRRPRLPSSGTRKDSRI